MVWTGDVAAAYGFGYVWEKDLAPAVDGKFPSTAELLAAPFRPVEETETGRHTLRMIQYFLEETQGRLPLSYCDVQSPLNTLSNIIDSTSSTWTSTSTRLDAAGHGRVRQTWLIDFTRTQQRLIGDAS